MMLDPPKPRTGIDTKAAASRPGSSGSYKRLFFLGIVAAMLLAGVIVTNKKLFTFYGVWSSDKNLAVSSVRVRKRLKPNATLAKDHFTSMLTSVLEARRKMIEKIRSDYGNDYFDQIFRDSDYQNKSNAEGFRMEYRSIRPVSPRDVEVQVPQENMRLTPNETSDLEQRRDPKYFNSVQNLQRKMMIRILSASLDPSSNNNSNNNNKYVWVTGGHSNAAANGNLFRESYTKVMEEASSEVFTAAGLELEARNFGIGATPSAPEVSMCFREVYGTDADFFSWDFGLTDGRQSGNLLHYVTRGLLSQRGSPNGIIPAFVAFDMDKPYYREAIMELHDAFRGIAKGERAENNGLALFIDDPALWKEMKKAIPDMADMSADEISQIPKLLQYFKCGDKIEVGEPLCREMKFNKECPTRAEQTGWHYGWKTHAMRGTSLALFLTEMLLGAVQQIEGAMQDNQSPEDLLSELRKHEDAFRDKLYGQGALQLPISSELLYSYNHPGKFIFPIGTRIINRQNEPFDHGWVVGHAAIESWRDMHYRIRYENGNEEELHAFHVAMYRYGANQTKSVELENGSDQLKENWKAFQDWGWKTLFHGPSICHTTNFPAQTRLLGHLTNQPELTGKQTFFGNETYFTGIESEAYDEWIETIKDHSEPHDMQLVWENDHLHQEDCGDVVVHPNYHDYWKVTQSEGCATVVFPNEAEQKAYGYHQHKGDYKGILVIVPLQCQYISRCERKLQEQYTAGNVTMRVNGRIVTSLTSISDGPFLMEHEDGIIFEPNEKGLYHLELEVNEPDVIVTITSIVLY